VARCEKMVAARRRGVLAFEMVLVLPLLLLVVLAMAQFSMLLTARQELLAACREGARVASHGGDRSAATAEAEDTVRRLLGGGRLAGSEVHVSWLPDDPEHPENGRERVEVDVAVLATLAAPDFLGWTGFTLSGQYLTAVTVMNVE
jgi:TadE-like protein